MDVFTDDYIENQRKWLLARRESKKEIMKKGGERALYHSPSDIVDIDMAIRRIDNGQYGLCPPCGLPIEKERLDFVPETLMCISCQTDSEKRIRHALN